MRYSAKIRFVDRYIGSCILFLFTLFHWVRPRPLDRSVRRVLIIELVEMGASIMGYASLRYVKEKVPGAELFVVCTESTKESWLLLDVLKPENVYALDNKSIWSLIGSIFKTRRALSRKKIDMIIDFELFTRISAIISFLIKSKLRAGFYGYTMGGLYRGNFLDVKCYFNQNMHISKNLLALTKSALDAHPRYYNWNGPIESKEIIAPSYESNTEVKKLVEQKLARKGTPLILIAPTVGKMLPMRDYPKEQYVEVIQKLLKEFPQHLLVLVGTKEHKTVTSYLEKEAHSDRCRDFAGETATLQELVELFSLGDLLITNDSGNPHFASMVSLPTLALYGPETPFMYGPLGKAVCLFTFFHTSPSITTYNHKNPPSADNDSLKAISPESVVEMAKKILSGEAVYGTVNGEIPYLM